MTRDEIMAEARTLSARGWSTANLASIYGVHVETMRLWLNPARAERARVATQARRESYRGKCAVCEVPTDGSNGPGKASTHCLKCSRSARSRSKPAAIDPRRAPGCSCDGLPVLDAEGEPLCTKCGRAKLGVPA